jgi:hypothetical protein
MVYVDSLGGEVAYIYIYMTREKKIRREKDGVRRI